MRTLWSVQYRHRKDWGWTRWSTPLAFRTYREAKLYAERNLAGLDTRLTKWKRA